MKKIIILSVAILLMGSVSFADTVTAELKAEDNVLSNKEIKAQLHKIKTKRIIIANALLLNNAQREKANDIYSKVFQKESILLAQLKKEQDILKSLNKENSNSAERKKQRKIVAELNNAINHIENDTDNEFKKILTREQRSKFCRLRKEITISDF